MTRLRRYALQLTFLACLVGAQPVWAQKGKPKNDPLVAKDDTATVVQGNTVIIPVLANDGPAGDVLSVQNVRQAKGVVRILEDGTLLYRPTPNFVGEDAFEYTITDGKKGKASARVRVQVRAAQANLDPVAADDAYEVDEDDVLAVAAPGILANDSDPDQDNLTAELVNGPEYGQLTLNDDGSFTCTPNANFNGSDNFTYTVSDGNGGSATATVTITVNPVNDAPVAYDQSVTTDEDASVAITLTASDVDGDQLSYEVINGPADGTLSGTAPSLTYTPNANFNGKDSFIFQVRDGAVSDQGTVSIFIGMANDLPVAVNDEAATDEDTPVTIPVLTNDSDPDGDALSVTSASEAANGSTAINPDGTVTYTPNENFNGSDSFTYTVSDGIAESNTATVTITVNPVNDAPVAADDEAATDENTPITIDVLANDTDEDGDDLSVASVTDPAHGTVQNNQDGTVTYTPDTGFNGTDTFTYTASDGSLLSNTATVTITVNLAEMAESEPIGAEGGSFNADFGDDLEASIVVPLGAVSEAINIQIGLYDTPPAGANLAGPVFFFGPSGATFDPPVTVTVPYDPDLLPEGFNPMDLVLLIYSEIDGTWEEADSSTVNTDAHTVSGQTYHFCGFAAGLPLNRAPQVIQSLPNPVINEDARSTVIIENLAEYFADPNFGDQIDFDATSLDKGLHLVLVANDSLIVEPKPNFYGDIRIVITATDLAGLSVSDTLFLTVVADNDPPAFPPGFRELLADYMTINEDQVLRIPLMADDVEGDEVTFNATSDTSAVTVAVAQDSVPILVVIPDHDWFGTANIGLSASDGQDTTYLDPVTLTVRAVNDAPSAFTLLEPANAAVIQLQSSDLGDSLTFAWDDAVDPDGDPVRYAFMLTDSVAFYFEYGDTTVNEMRVPYADILAAIRDQELTSATFWWTIMAISGQDTTEADNGPYNLTIDASTLAVVDQSQLPQFFTLHQNYPNPFNPVTTLQYELPHNSRVLLVIYDMRGREVIRLVDGYVSAGYNKVVWNSSDASGRPVPSGIYFARLITSEYTHIIKMSLIR